MPEGYNNYLPSPITAAARVDPILFYFIPPIMHQNVSLRYLGFEQRPPSLFCWKAKSLHHTMRAGVKVFNLRPSAALLSSANPPGCLLVSQRSLLTSLVFGSGQKPDIVFPFRAGQKHDRCPWKQHLRRCFQFFEEFRGFFFNK